MEFLCAFDQGLFGLRIVGIGNAAINRAYRRALFLIEKPDAFGALVRSDVIRVLLDGVVEFAVEFPWSAAFVDGGVRALRFTRAAVDAFLRDECRHFPLFESGETTYLIWRLRGRRVAPRFNRTSYCHPSERASRSYPSSGIIAMTLRASSA